MEKNIRLGFRKGCVIPEQFDLLLIKQKNHDKDSENSYFGGLDVANKLLVYSRMPQAISVPLIFLTIIATLEELEQFSINK